MGTLVGTSISIDGNDSYKESWELGYEGRRFLVENNLIS